MMKHKRQIPLKWISILLSVAMLWTVIVPLMDFSVFASGTWSADDNWEVSVADGGQAFKKISSDIWALATLSYNGKVDFNTVEFDYKFNQSNEIDGNITFAIFLENSGQYNLEINVGMNKFVRFRRYQPETVFGINGISPVITNFIVTDRITGSIYGPARFMNSSFERVVHKGTGYHDEMNWTSGLTYWSNSGTVGTVSIGEKQSQAVDTKEIITVQNHVGYVKGEGELYQGLYKTTGAYVYNLQVKAEKSGAKLFVRDAITQQMIAQKEVAPSAEWREETLSFVLDASTTVQLGISYSGDEEDIVYIDDAVVMVDPDSDTYKVEGDRLEIDFTDGMEGFISTNPSGVAVKDGIVQTDASAEHKILLESEDLKVFEISVDILNPTKGLNTGLYILASDAAAGQDKIKAYNVQLESVAGSNIFGVQVYRFKTLYGIGCFGR